MHIMFRPLLVLMDEREREVVFGLNEERASFELGLRLKSGF